MPKVLFRLVRSEWRLQAVLGYLAVVILPLGIALIGLAAKYEPLQSPDVLDQAQLARHIVRGEGFTTSVVRPLSLLFHADVPAHPDLYNPPVPPLLLSVFYSILRPSGRVTAGASIAVWIVSVALTFLVAHIWANGRVAGLSAVFYASNPALVLSATQGSQYVTAGIFTLVAVWAVFVPHADIDESRPASLPEWRYICGGAAAGLAFLTHFQMIHLVFVLAGYLLATRGRHTRTVRWLAFGFILTIAPWILRNIMVQGAPWFGLYWNELMARTSEFPGDSIWRTLSPPPNPVWFALTHPLQLLQKLIAGLTEIRGQFFAVVEPIIVFLLVASVVGNLHHDWPWRGLGGIALAGLAALIVTSSLLRPDSGLVLSWTPVASVVAALQLSDWVRHRISRPPSIWSEADKESSSKTTLNKLRIGTRATRVLVHVTVIVVVIVPLAYFLTTYRPPQLGPLWGSARALNDRLPAGARVMTDQPALVAWYADRPAILLCQDEDDFPLIEQVTGPVDAFYITAAVAQLPANERADWWAWVFAPRGIYRQFAPSGIMPTGVMLRTRGKGSASD